MLTAATLGRQEPFDEVRRLGLQASTEALVRAQHPTLTGLLVVEHVVPKGPASGALEPGDVLTRINGKLVVDFVQLDGMLDDSRGDTVQVEVERGPERLTLALQVQDLHSITPDKFVSVSGAVLHALSYQMARGYSVPVGSVFVATPGYMFGMAGIQRACVITALDGKPTPDMEAFTLVLVALQDHARVAVRYFNLSDIYRERVALVQVDRRWAPCTFSRRNDATGTWDTTTLPLTPGVFTPAPATARFPRMDNAAGPASLLARSLVAVICHVPYQIDGVQGTNVPS